MLKLARVLAVAAVVVALAGLFLASARGRDDDDEKMEKEKRIKTAAAQVEEELTLYKDLPVLEDQDYDMLANFDVLSELPRGDMKVDN